MEIVAAGLVVAALAADPSLGAAPPAAPAVPVESAPRPAPPPSDGEERLVPDSGLALAILSGGPQEEWVGGVRSWRNNVLRIAAEDGDPRIATIRFSADASDSDLAAEVGVKVLTPRAPARVFATAGVGGGHAGDDGGATALSAGAGVQSALGPLVVEVGVWGRLLLPGAEANGPRHRQAFATVGIGYRLPFGR